MVTFNDNRWVFPPVPTARACAKSDEYLWKLRNQQSMSWKRRVISGNIRKWAKLRKPKSKVSGEMGNPKAIVSDAEETIRNTIAKMANALSSCEGGWGWGGPKMKWGLGEIERFFQLEDDSESLHKECEHLRNIKNVDDLGKGGEIIQLRKENWKSRRIWKIELRNLRKKLKRGTLRDWSLIGQNPKGG